MIVRRVSVGTVVSYLVAAALVAVFLHQVAWRGIGDGLRTARWSLVVAATIVRVIAFGVSALRWQMLLRPAAHVPLRGVVAVTLIGAAATAVAPVQAAELVRPYLLSRRHGVALSTTLATTAAEWLLDAAALMALFLPALAWQRTYGHSGPDGSWLAVAAAPALCLLIACAGLVLLRSTPGWIESLVESARWRDRMSAGSRRCVIDRVHAFATGLRTLRQPSGVLAVGAYSLLFFGLTALASWLTLRAFAMPVSVVAGLLVLGLVTIAALVPTPGAIGGFHAVCQVGLVTLFDLTRAQTVLPVIALHAVLTFPAAILGAVVFIASPTASSRG
ncbi:MAG: lysylphosphatidylglycerol synthase transmembrane domain-containing protein [Acidobacteriota bacterium]